jgi:hypothetical protein
MSSSSSSSTATSSSSGEQYVHPFSGTGDTVKTKYQTWVEQMDIALVAKPERWRRIIKGTQTLTVTNDNVEFIANETFKDMNRTRSKDAMYLWGQDYFWTVEYQQERVTHDLEQVFGWLCIITEGTARNQIRTLGVKRVNEMWANFQQDYGITLNTDIRERERELEVGITRPDKKAMQVQDDMCVHIQKLEDMQSSLRDLLSAEDRATNKYMTKEMLAQILCDSVHRSPDLP